MQMQNRTAIFEQVKQGLRNLGYVGGLLQEDYEFADVLTPHYGVNRVPLAAFAQDPPSYRNACFGVVHANGMSGASLVQGYRSLGAPQVLEVRSDCLLRWKMTGHGDPLFLEKLGPSDIPGLFRNHRDDWSPTSLLRAKSAGDVVATQLDFLDVGLLPLLEQEVRAKLDRLLRDTVVLAIETYRHHSEFTDRQYPPLFRLMFRLLAAKILADRRHPGTWLEDDSHTVIRSVQDFYFKDTKPEPVLEDSETQEKAWERIKEAFHFQNLSVDSLAYVYENTLVTPETRRLYGIHSTPPAIAEYVVRHLPFEDLAENERRVFEPFSGHAVFLIAAMQRMRELLPPQMTSEQRHSYFVNMLSGMELDDFAREVARLSLMLADYPNPDGWRLHKGDAFESASLDQELSDAKIVLCNPPFEDFGQDQQAHYRGLSSVHKPADILHRVLQKPPDMLGFVLPRVFLTGRGYRQLRSELGQTYSAVELVALPDRVFQHSDVETVLLMAFAKDGNTVRLRTGEVYKKNLENFYVARRPSYESEEIVENATERFEESIWLPPLQEVWKATASLKRLGDLASVHRGIEYNVPFEEHRLSLVSQTELPGFSLGVHRVKDAIEPFAVRKTMYLNISPELMRGSAYKLPWGQPKLIVNARCRTRGHWRLTASPDYQGLVCYQNFHGIWPATALPLEVLSAILNGPLANAFVSTREGKRDVRVMTLEGIPIPILSETQTRDISVKVRQYIDVRLSWLFGAVSASEAQDTCGHLLRLIDAEVLEAYDLPPRTERALLDYFADQSRPGPVEFRQYFPATFKPYIPWHRYLSTRTEESKASETLRRLPVISDPLISEALSPLYEATNA
ncbi:MAG: N-6 DNA methylase [Chloroflexi bacterium]|nr:N-6 DNA methylase [Chloroflexota bacterium]